MGMHRARYRNGVEFHDGCLGRSMNSNVGFSISCISLIYKEMTLGSADRGLCSTGETCTLTLGNNSPNDR